MTDAALRHSVVRRLKNFPLAPSPDNALIGVYEAISNSIHSAFDSGKPQEKEIVVDVIRNGAGAIEGFRIADNGIGLNDANFDSFRDLDSDYKLKRGGKGVGRLTWLKTFERVRVTSRFSQDGEWLERSFSFVADDATPFPDYSLGPSDKKLSETIVDLEELKPEYAEVAPKKSDTVLKAIARHFVKDLIAANSPKIIIRDGSNTELNSFFKNNIVRSDEDTFEVEIQGKKQKFSIKHFLASNYLKDQETNENTVYFLAHGRVVDRRGIGGLIGLKRLANGQTYLGLIESKFFDAGVTQERTMFTLNVEVIDVVTRAAAESAAKFLHDETAPIRTRQVQMLKILRREYPRFIGTIRDEAKFVEDKLTLGATNQESVFRAVSLEWYRNKRRVDREIRVGLKNASSPAEIAAAVSKIMSAVDVETKAALADYMAERKVIIDLFDDLLSKIKSGEHHYEEELHNVVCPTGHNADQLAYANHNLWLLDERLPYYTFFNSDLSIAAQTEKGKGGKEPDLTFFDISLAFEQNKEPVPIIIVEFKRPGRDDYSGAKNPIDQCLDYVERIKDGNAAVDSKGKHVSWIDPESLFYCYVVADIKPTLRKIITKHDLTKTPDGRGYWKYHEGLKCMIEVIPYDKIVESNRTRHEAFFEKLGIN